MKKFIQNIKNIWKVEELRKRIILTLSLILVYRIGSFVILPGVNYAALAASNAKGDSNALTTLLSLFSGGGFSNASIMALGIMPYISASIIMQLLGMAVPAVQKMQNEGESGRKQINNYTRILTIIICALQAPSYLSLYVDQKQAMPADASTFWWTQTILILIAGSMFAVWLGERITEKGIGNGISLLIMVGILARMPEAFIQEVGTNSSNPMKIIIEIIIWLVVIIATILLVMALRKVQVQYARRSVSGDFESDSMDDNRQFIPLKLNSAGVMPIIFAQAIMFIPAALAGLSKSDTALSISNMFKDPFGLVYNVVFALLIVIFTYFYTAITVPTNKMADDLKRSGGFIPGIKPGAETGDFLDKLMSLITFPGSLFLALIAVFPAIIHGLLDVQGAWAYFYGGTSLIIMVGVAIDTIQQINSYLLNKHYDGLMKSGKNRKAVA